MNTHGGGIIASINHPRGFGFIRQLGRKQDLFFAASVVEGGAFSLLRRGQHVVFEEDVSCDLRGPRCARVNVDAT